MNLSLKVATLSAVLCGFSGLTTVRAHCEIPCGIFDDHLRIHMIEENITTINKSMAMIRALSKEQKDAQTMNQIVRWVGLKETQATAVQTIVTQYFLAQRISPGFDQEVYVDLLKKAHALIVYAMKTKQTVDDDVIGDFRKALKSFQKAYTKAAKAKKK